MGRKNTNARERVSPETVDKTIKRLSRENSIYKAHQRKDEFSMSYSQWLDSKERLSK